jgi:hypothetical protein
MSKSTVTPKGKSIFLSYAQGDTDRFDHSRLVEHVVREVVPRFGADRTVDDPADLAALTGNPRDAILDRIREASGVVALWSSRAAASPWVLYELGAAFALDKPITVVLIEKDAPRLPADLAGAEVLTWTPSKRFRTPSRRQLT